MVAPQDPIPNYYNNYIDSATIGGVLSIFRRDHIEDTHPWARRTAMETTCALINDVEKLGLAPYAGNRKYADSLLKYTMDKLVHIVSKPSIGEDDKRRAFERTSRFIENDISLFRDKYNQLKTDDKFFMPWLEDLKNNSWKDYANIYGGLIQERFLQDISLIMDIDMKDLQRIAHSCRDGNALEKVLKNGADVDENISIMKDGFALSVILSGIFHNFMAQEKNLKILLHPVRREFFQSADYNSKYKIDIARPTSFLSCIIIANAFNERRTEERIAVWSRYILKAREYLSSKELDPNLSLESRENAINRAIIYAKDIGIDKRSFGKCLDLFIMILSILCYFQAETRVISYFSAASNVILKASRDQSIGGLVNDISEISRRKKYALLMGVLENDLSE